MWKAKEKANKASGITLVALVVTVVALLILAGITINLILGPSSIFETARKAGEETNKAVENEQAAFGNLTNYLTEQGWANGSGGNGGTGENPNPDVPEIPKGPNGKPLVGTVTTPNNNGNTEVEDMNGNPITIPAGFTVVPNSGEKPSDKLDEEWNAEKVTYNYDTENHTPCVQDGIVIQDSEGNQFVWIPIGTIYNKEKDASGNRTTTEITLGRYEFKRVKNSTTGLYEDGTPTLKQEATTLEADKDKDNYYTKAVTIGTYFQELPDTTDNTPAKLKAFIDNAKAKGGYYLARYEASEKKITETESKPMSKANQTAWVSMTQPKAATYARSMYNGNNNCEVDLINSYSWDTAIVFIQKYSENSNYANKVSVNDSTKGKLETGRAGDIVCNIHDMASNCYEWVTEHSTRISSNAYPCASRGGSCRSSNYYTASRNTSREALSYADVSFRVVLY